MRNTDLSIRFCLILWFTTDKLALYFVCTCMLVEYAERIFTPAGKEHCIVILVREGESEGGKV